MLVQNVHQFILSATVWGRKYPVLHPKTVKTIIRGLFHTVNYRTYLIRPRNKNIFLVVFWAIDIHNHRFYWNSSVIQLDTPIFQVTETKYKSIFIERCGQDTYWFFFPKSRSLRNWYHFIARRNLFLKAPFDLLENFLCSFARWPRIIQDDGWRKPNNMACNSCFLTCLIHIHQTHRLGLKHSN